jgi:hypothetical protein
MKITPIIKKYVTALVEDDYHRYRSWDNCHQAFNTPEQTEIHTLELAFYLASWGMYRGSSGLLQKNHRIHKGAVDIIFSSAGRSVQCNTQLEVGRNMISNILNLKEELARHYGSIFFTKGASKAKAISTTDTLLSKVMLGTLGCVPAYDRYFINGLKLSGMKHSSFDSLSLNELLDFAAQHQADIKASQDLVQTLTQKHYPLMKILDMYFWQIGYDSAIAGKQT